MDEPAKYRHKKASPCEAGFYTLLNYTLVHYIKLYTLR